MLEKDFARLVQTRILTGSLQMWKMCRTRCQKSNDEICRKTKIIYKWDCYMVVSEPHVVTLLN